MWTLEKNNVRTEKRESIQFPYPNLISCWFSSAVKDCKRNYTKKNYFLFSLAEKEIYNAILNILELFEQIKNTLSK